MTDCLVLKRMRDMPMGHSGMCYVESLGSVVWVQNGLYHSFYGPAYSCLGEEKYYIWGVPVRKERWERDPEVVLARTTRKLEMIVSYDATL